MTKRELFESRVHAMACAVVSTMGKSTYSGHIDAEFQHVTRPAIDFVLDIDAALAEIPHAEAPEAPSGWRPMSEIGEAVGWIVIAFLPRDSVVRYSLALQFVRERHRPQPNDLAWLQLPPISDKERHEPKEYTDRHC